MTLSEMRARLRKDLHDEDSENYRWSDATLDRHIERAVREASLSVPLEAKTVLQTTASSRELSLASVADLVSVEAVEYPVGYHPPRYVRFSLWSDTLTLLIEAVPGEGEDVNLYHTKLHTLDGTGSTIPLRLEDLAATGGAAYAALEWASFATNRVNVGGDETWRNYLVWGQEQLSRFAQGLARHARRNAARSRRLYRPYEPKPSQTTDWGP